MIKEKERQGLEAHIKDVDHQLFVIGMEFKGKEQLTPDEYLRLRGCYTHRCSLLKLYREKYGRESEYQLRDDLDDLRQVYLKKWQATAKEKEGDRE